MVRRPFVVFVALAVAGVTALPAQAAPPGPFMRVIVQLDDQVDSPGGVLRQFLGAAGQEIAVYEHALTGFAAELPAAAVWALSRDSRVVEISHDPIVSIAAETLPTGVDRVESDLVPWGDVSTTATHCPTGSDCADVDIAILDTGIELYHPDLNVYRATNCTVGFFFPSCQNAGDLFDRNGHGTHVAGTAAACDNEFGVVGPASCARLWSFKVLADDGTGFASWIIEGIDTATAYAAEIDVVNMSITGEFSIPAFDQALSNSVAAGIVYVVAAGNSSKDSATFSPASNDDMITVSAIADFDGMGGGYDSDNSCYPSDTDDVFATFSNFGADVDIAAPGVCIYSTHLNDGYATYAGTSMASPLVAGTAALYIAKHGRDVNGDSVVNGGDAAALRSILQAEGLPQGHPCSFTGDTDGLPEPLLFVNGTGPAFGGDGTCTMATGSSNTLPVAANDGGAVDEDTTLAVAAPGVLANDTDADGDPLTAILDTAPSNGSLTLNADGSYSYTPNADFNGSDSFTYRANDGTGDSNVATVDITVNPINDAPTAAPDSESTDEDTALAVSALSGVLSNDSDVDGDPLTAVLDSGPNNAASFGLNPDGSFTYTPATDFNGFDSFTYHAHDGTAPSSTVTVDITVNSINDPPTAANDAHSISEDTTLIVNASIGVLLNDDDGGDGPSPLTAVLDTGPANAAAFSLGSDGSYSYTPAADFNGVDSFTYHANDGADASNIATVTITVDPVNDPPVAVADSESVDEDTPLSVNGVLNNDTDVDDVTLTAVLDTGPSNADAFVLNPDGSFDYTPMADFNGADSFTYHANDGSADSNTVTVDITVNPVNDAPVAAAESDSVNEDSSLVVIVPGVLGNDTDMEGDPLTAVLDTDVSSGALSLNSDGSFTYTPNPNYFGADSFTYHANDGSADSNTVTVDITVNPINDPPVATSDDYSTTEDVPLSVPGGGVLDNDTDVEGDSLTAILDTDVANGVLTLNPDGSFNYSPDTGYNGPDSFTYHAHDGSAPSGVVTVTIAVNPINDPPVADNDSYGTNEDTTLNIPAPGVLNGDSDPDGDPLAAVLSTDVSNGTLALNPDGSFTYTPDPDYNGPDSFSYWANDGIANSNLASVTLTVNALNDPPVATGDAYATDEDAALSVPADGVLGNDTDVDADTLTAVLNTDVSNGTLGLNADGSFTYSPDAEYSGSDSFTYHAHDGTVASNIVTVNITVTPVNDPPVADNDSYSTDEDVTLNVPTPGVLAGDTDTEGDPLTAVVDTNVSNGTLGLNPDGSFTYTPNQDFNGADSFTYRANDGLDNSNVATVTITVNPINDAPVASADAYSTDEDTALNTAAPGVLGNDSDVDGDSLAAVVDTDVSNGSLTLNADGSFTYTPAAGYFGGDSFTYHAHDGIGSSNIVTVDLTINEAVPTSTPKLANGFVTGVSTDGWTTVTPGPSYTSMVVVATPNYDSGTVPLVVRVRNVTSTTFEVSLARTAGSGIATATVYWMTVEEGVYTTAEHGVTMEAVTFTSTVTDENNAWNGELRTYGQSYSTAVVLGQVMSANDSDWSVFWSRGSGRNRPPNGTLRVGKHVGEDSDVTRVNETIGYVIIEAGSGSIEGTPYLAAVGGDSIRGVTNSPPYSYSISGPGGATVAVASQTGMDGNNGGWALLYGNNPVSASSLGLAIDEDQVKDSERRHTTEQVAYIVFG